MAWGPNAVSLRFGVEGFIIGFVERFSVDRQGVVCQKRPSTRSSSDRAIQFNRKISMMICEHAFSPALQFSTSCKKSYC